MFKPIAEAIETARLQERNYRAFAESLERIAKHYPDAIYDAVKVVTSEVNPSCDDVYVEREKTGLVMAHPYLHTPDGDVVFGESIAVGDVKPGGDIDNGCWRLIMRDRGYDDAVIEMVGIYLGVQAFPKGVRG